MVIISPFGRILRRRNKESLRGLAERQEKEFKNKDVFRTSKNEGHRHTWKRGNTYTSIDNRHKHKVSRGVALPAGKNNHKHKILKN